MNGWGTAGYVLLVLLALTASAAGALAAGRAVAAADRAEEARNAMLSVRSAAQASVLPGSGEGTGRAEFHYCRHCGELIEAATQHPGWIHLRTLVQHCEDRLRAHVWRGTIAEPVMPPPGETKQLAAVDECLHLAGADGARYLFRPDPDGVDVDEIMPGALDAIEALPPPVLCRNCELPIEAGEAGPGVPQLWRHVRTQLHGCSLGIVDDVRREHALRGFLAEPPRVCAECGAGEDQARLMGSVAMFPPGSPPEWCCADVRDCVGRKRQRV